MDQMIVDPEGKLHQVSDDIGVFRDLDAEGVLYGVDRGQGVRARAHAADALHKGPGVSRIAILDDDFDTPEHGTRRNRVGDHVFIVDVDLATQMPFDAGNGIDDDAPPRVVYGKALRGVFVRHDQFLLSGVEAWEVSSFFSVAVGCFRRASAETFAAAASSAALATALSFS